MSEMIYRRIGRNRVEVWRAADLKQRDRDYSMNAQYAAMAYNALNNNIPYPSQPHCPTCGGSHPAEQRAFSSQHGILAALGL